MGKLKEFINGTAFRPHPLDMRASIKERLAGMKSVLVKLCKDKAIMKVVMVDKTATVASEIETVQVEVESMSDVNQSLSELVDRHDLQYALVVFSAKFNFNDAAHLDMPEDIAEVQEILMESPAELLGDDYQRDYRYVPIRHPSTTDTYLFSMEANDVAKVVNHIERLGLEVVRVSNPIASSLNYVFQTQVLFDHLEGPDQLFVLLDEEAFLLAHVSGQALDRPRCRGEQSELIEMIRREITEKTKRLVFLSTRNGQSFEKEIREVVGDLPIVNLMNNAATPDVEVMYHG